VRIAKPRQDGARAGETERFDQFPPEQPKRHSVEQQDAIVGETQDSSVLVELQQLLQVEVEDSHRQPLKKRGHAITLIGRGGADGNN
jgi:hypothetical protein